MVLSAYLFLLGFIPFLISMNIGPLLNDSGHGILFTIGLFLWGCGGLLIVIRREYIGRSTSVFGFIVGLWGIIMLLLGWVLAFYIFYIMVWK